MRSNYTIEEMIEIFQGHIEEFNKNVEEDLKKGRPISMDGFSLPQALYSLCLEVKELRYQLELRGHLR